MTTRPRAARGAAGARRATAWRPTPRVDRPTNTSPMPASRIPESCMPISKRRMKTSLLPGRIEYRPFHVVRPNVISVRDHEDGTRARPATNVRQRTMHTTIPTAAEDRDDRDPVVARRTTGPCTSQSRGAAARRSRSPGRSPRGPGCAPPSATAASTGTMTQADASNAEPPTSTARTNRRRRSDGTRNGKTTTATNAR